MLAKQPNNRRVPHILVEKNRPDEDVLDEVYLTGRRTNFSSKRRGKRTVCTLCVVWWAF